MAGTCPNGFPARSTVLVVNNRRINGLSEANDAVNWEYVEDVGKVMEGLNGAVQLVMSGSKVARVTVKVFASHPDFEFLKQLANSYRNATDCKPCSLSVVNSGVGETGSSDMGMVVNDGNSAYGKGAEGERVFTFMMADFNTDPLNFEA